MKKDLFEELDSLKEELGVSDEHLKGMWNLFAYQDYLMKQWLNDPNEEKTEKELRDEFEEYVNNINGDFPRREKILKRFVNYCRWINKQR